MKRRPAAIPAVCLGVAALSVFGALNSYQVSSGIAQQSPDPFAAAAAETRLAPILERIPANATLAYLSDVPQEKDAGKAMFFAAQNALAPRLLIFAGAGRRPDFALGNFSSPGDFTSAGAQAGYSVIQDFGNGVVLYRKTEP
jgi:hypothetical protein